MRIRNLIHENFKQASFNVFVVGRLDSLHQNVYSAKGPSACHIVVQASKHDSKRSSKGFSVFPTIPSPLR